MNQVAEKIQFAISKLECTRSMLAGLLEVAECVLDKWERSEVLPEQALRLFSLVNYLEQIDRDHCALRDLTDSVVKDNDDEEAPSKLYYLIHEPFHPNFQQWCENYGIKLYIDI